MRDELRAIPLFADLAEEDLDLLAAGACEEQLPAGAVMFHEGDPGDRACVITAGEVEVVKASGSREVLLAVRKPGDVIGEMSLIDAAPRMATVRTRTATTFLTIPKQQMDDLLRTSATAARALFGVLLARWRETESSLRQSERMAQIGTLTAGLAHEMNNPAAAVRRGSAQLANAVDRLMNRVGDLRAAQLDVTSAAGVDDLLAAARHRSETLGALERADREAQVEETIADLDVADSWSLAPMFVAAGVDSARLATALSGLDSAAATLVIHAFCSIAETNSLVSEVEEGAERLSAIVASLKGYSYLDQAEVQEIDVRQGLDDTILILKHKLSDIAVQRDYPDDPPSIEAYAGELNQVWTNLIDNAADALLGGNAVAPSIVVRVNPTPGGLIVEVEDNGPGIPSDVVERVFDAFFTTKPPGSGTGLGLDITYATVVHRHGGDISVESEPGRTVFSVELPRHQS